MPSPRLLALLALIGGVCTACAPLKLGPAALSARSADVQGATFFAEPAPGLPAWPETPALVQRRLPPLDGGAPCGADPGEQMRAQCLRGVEGRLHD